MKKALLQMSLDLPDEARSVPFCRRVVRLMLQERQVEAQQAADIELAIGEATGNVVLHAYPDAGHYYRVTLAFFSDRVRLRVLDQGQGFDPSRLAPPDTEQVGGRGVWLIEHLADQTTYRTRLEGGCRLEAVFRLKATPGAREAEVGHSGSRSHPPASRVSGGRGDRECVAPALG